MRKSLFASLLVVGALSACKSRPTEPPAAGALIGMGIPEYEAKRYESFLHKGGALLSVHADDRDWAKRAKLVLDRCGAKDIDKMSEASGKAKAS
ncbi:MAG TPA: hypothetical protein VFK02_04555 [Kofleriaceae bacterium]|nr:hypothetical protein [Kofleriaceae bacterium]